MIKRLICIFLFVVMLAFVRVLEAQIIKVINNKGTISTIDTSRAITGSVVYVASPEQYTLTSTSEVQVGTLAIFTPTSANTSTVPLLQAGKQTTGAVITKNGHQALAVGDIAVGIPVIFIFDGTNWVLQNSQANGSSGGAFTIGSPVTATDAKGATVSGNTFSLEFTDATHPGIVSTGTQTFSGGKIFNSPITVFGLGEGGTPTNTYIRGAQAGGSGTAGANLYIQASNGTGAGGSGSILFQTGSANTISVPTASNVVTLVNSSTTATFSNYTVSSSGSNKLLMVEINFGYSGASVSSITYGASSFTSLFLSSDNHQGVWYLTNPPSGSNNIVVNLSNGGKVTLVAMTWDNVNQTTPFGTVSYSSGYNNNTSISLSPVSSLGQVIADFLISTTSPTTASGQTPLFSTTTNDMFYHVSGYKTATASTTTMSYTCTGNNYDYMAFAINPVTTGGVNLLSDALKINSAGNTVLASNKKLSFTDSSSGTVSLTAPTSITSSYSLTFPMSQGGGSTVLTNDGNGTLSWTSSSNSSWQPYTPSIGVYDGTAPTTGNGTVISGLYKVMGKSLKCKVTVCQESTAGTSGSGHYTISLPSGYQIDTDLMALATNDLARYPQTSPAKTSTLPCGFGFADYQGSSTNGPIQVVPATATSVAMLCGVATTNSYVKFIGSSWFSLSYANMQYSMEFEVPIK